MRGRPETKDTPSAAMICHFLKVHREQILFVVLRERLGYCSWHGMSYNDEAVSRNGSGTSRLGPGHQVPTLLVDLLG